MARDGMASALESIGEVRAVNCARFFLGLVEIAADEAAPASISARRKVEDEGVGMKLRVEISACVVVEASNRQAGDGLADRAALAAPSEGVMVFEMGGGGMNSFAVCGFNHRTFGRRRKRPNDRDRFRSREGHVPAWGVRLSNPGEALASSRIMPIQSGFEIRLGDGAFKRKAFRAPALPFPICLGFALACVVFVLRHMLEITHRGGNGLPGGDRCDHQASCSRENEFRMRRAVSGDRNEVRPAPAVPGSGASSRADLVVQSASTLAGRNSLRCGYGRVIS